MIQVWVCETDTGCIPRAFLNYLEPAEEERSLRFRVQEDRRAYLVGRILLRMALSRAIGGDPRSWRFITGETGKISLAHAPGATPVDFSLSHSGSAVAVAISSSGQVGLDIERMEAPELDVDGVFTEREIESLRSGPKGSRWERMLQLWTVKEAYAKLLGLGLRMDLRDFEVLREPREWKIAQAQSVKVETHELGLKSGRYHLALAAKPSANSPVAIRLVSPLDLAG